jgi:hypothetical protein
MAEDAIVGGILSFADFFKAISELDGKNWTVFGL